jgi:hypothetical protein
MIIMTSFSIPEDEIALLSGSYSSETKAIIVSPKNIRVYEDDELTVLTHGLRDAKSACFTETWMLIMGLTSTETTIKGFLIESDLSSPGFDIGFPQNHGGTG